jgi:hypothetical protein
MVRVWVFWLLWLLGVWLLLFVITRELLQSLAVAIFFVVFNMFIDFGQRNNE